jgi:hypothetical protein
MKKSFFILLVPLLLGMAQCRKDKYTPFPLGKWTVIKGKVLELETKKPIPNAQILVKGCPSTDFGGFSSCRPMDTVFSQADGSYEARFLHEEATSFECQVTVHNYYSGTDLSRENPFIRYGNENTINFILEPYAWIQFHVKNIHPFDAADHILFGAGKGWGNDDVSCVGTQVDTFITRRIAGNQIQKISGRIERNGQNKITLNDSIYCKGHDTTFHKLYF